MPTPHAHPAAAKRRALIVDDTPEHRNLTKAMLSLRGFEVIEAVNGADALKLLGERARPGALQFDLVFSDVSMPNMNGFELLKRVRREPLLRHIPFVLLTSENRPEDIDTGKRLGCTYYMLKPFSSDALKKALAAANLG